MTTQKIPHSDFEQKILNQNGIALVDFYADWCGPCKLMTPVIDEIAKEHPDITVAKINVDENEKLAAEYNILSIPTIIIFKNGTEFSRAVGYTPKQDLELYLILSR